MRCEVWCYCFPSLFQHFSLINLFFSVVSKAGSRVEAQNQAFAPTAHLDYLTLSLGPNPLFLACPFNFLFQTTTISPFFVFSLTAFSSPLLSLSACPHCHLPLSTLKWLKHFTFAFCQPHHALPPSPLLPASMLPMSLCHHHHHCCLFNTHTLTHTLFTPFAFAASFTLPSPSLCCALPSMPSMPPKPTLLLSLPSA